MYPKGILASADDVRSLETRLARLTPGTARLWGTLTPHEMLCHLSDAFLATLGERPVSFADTFFQRTLVKWLALHTPMPWPKGIPTRPEVDPRRAGSRPAEFEADRAACIRLLRRFAAPETTFGRHPIFGPMSRAEWLTWGFGHVDHHLRQFGL